ncbi:MAG: hypothetical protein L7F78_15585 [Syntrophales bacterium LBB04]|nr:hypothetical protein [Syntrophales bacterium LBB04]
MLRAIDAQQVILQIEHAEKVQQVQQQHPEMQQRYFGIHLNEEQRLIQKKVKDAEEARKAITEKRVQAKKDQEKRREGGQHDGDEDSLDELNASEEEQGGHINIKV